MLIRVRDAANRLGATEMDRPEDIERDPVTGTVFMAMSNNSNRVETAPADRPGTGPAEGVDLPDGSAGRAEVTGPLARG